MNGLQEKTQWSQTSYEDAGQWENWLELRDAANAIRYGFSKNRLPRLGSRIDKDKIDMQMFVMEAEWKRECDGRNPDGLWGGSPEFSGMPFNAQIHLYQNLTKTNA